MAKKKKATKKAAPKRAKQTRPATVVVRVQSMPTSLVPTTTDLTEPLKDGKALSMQKTWLSEKQILRLTERTPAQFVYKRPAKGGGQWDYVTVSYVQRVLDYAFGFNWDFEVVEHGKEDDHVWVRGRLTIRNASGTLSIRKEQFGRSEVKKKAKEKGGGNLDYGNDLKAAASDALKKCASMLGIARDIYGKTDYKAETGTSPRDPQSPAPAEAVVVDENADRNPDLLCNVSGCDTPDLSQQEYDYSKRLYGRPLCRTHQARAKRK